MTAQDCVELAKDHGIWLAIGFMGQAMFSARFLIQWLASEKVKKSIIPNLFWWFSIGGGSILLIYAIHRADPVFIVGQAAGLFIYVRNIYLIYKKQHPDHSALQPDHKPQTEA
ncbi:MAG: lipid-A-disaccharide synthase N-terminal domain-containing protein [Alphaproteobacteria bacterium]|nr:lipid-A-disaccharide synthase N-terminal domain-containing protein [Alphaproteobacteria bacterium]